MQKNLTEQPSSSQKPHVKEGKPLTSHHGSSHTTREQQEHSGTGWQQKGEPDREKK